MVAQLLALIPDFVLGVSGTMGSPVSTLKYGGVALSAAANFSASMVDTEANEHTYRASLHGTLGNYQRRAQEWLQQAQLASIEVQQVTKQLAAAGLRLAISAQEIRNHDLQAANAREVDEFMRDKYSNRELYDWMIGQSSAVYFRAYQLAYDVAKRAERAFRYELGLTDSNYIQFGYWDSLKRGLFAGEHLASDLKRMEVAYLELNKREYEITRHVSLVSLDPGALIALKALGQCEVELPEWLFDLDFPGHFMRRVKSVSLTIPCVVGPYTNLNCKLTLLRSSIRLTSVASGSYPQNLQSDDPRFKVTFGISEAIATSHGQNDSGLFELNFRDERYLPFEGSGVISRWRIELPPDSNQFDLMSISDVILHVKYTAREGGDVLANKARAALNDLFKSSDGDPVLKRVFSVRHEFAGQLAQYRVGWARYLTEWAAADSGNKPAAPELRLDVAGKFPYFVRKRPISVNGSRIYVTQSDGKLQGVTVPTDLTSPWPTVTLTSVSDSTTAIDTPSVTLSFDPVKIEDLLVLCAYTIG